MPFWFMAFIPALRISDTTRSWFGFGAWLSIFTV